MRASSTGLQTGLRQSSLTSWNKDVRTTVITAEEGPLRMEKNPLILVIDDEELILKLLNVDLTAEGYDVITASDGLSALALLEKHTPDLVILDIMMPGFDGIQTLRQLRKRSNVPVIMLTARSEVSVLRDSLALGADDYITKPFSMQVLAAHIRAKLRLAERGNKAAEAMDTIKKLQDNSPFI